VFLPAGLAGAARAIDGAPGQVVQYAATFLGPSHSIQSRQTNRVEILSESARPTIDGAARKSAAWLNDIGGALSPAASGCIAEPPHHGHAGRVLQGRCLHGQAHLHQQRTQLDGPRHRRRTRDKEAARLGLFALRRGGPGAALSVADFVAYRALARHLGPDRIRETTVRRARGCLRLVAWQLILQVSPCPRPRSTLCLPPETVHGVAAVAAPRLDAVKKRIYTASYSELPTRLDPMHQYRLIIAHFIVAVAGVVSMPDPAMAGTPQISCRPCNSVSEIVLMVGPHAGDYRAQILARLWIEKHSLMLQRRNREGPEGSLRVVTRYPASMADFRREIQQLADDCLRIKSLGIVGHGNVGYLRLGTDGVALETLSDAFGNGLDCAISPDAFVEMMVCNLGRGCRGAHFMVAAASHLLRKGGRIIAPDHYVFGNAFFGVAPRSILGVRELQVGADLSHPRWTQGSDWDPECPIKPGVTTPPSYSKSAASLTWSK
jgi:hypothetical protein